MNEFKMYKQIKKIELCPTVNFFFSDYGFLFLHTDDKEKVKIKHLEPWEKWEYYAGLYCRPNEFPKKWYDYCDNLPEHEKIRKYYQAVYFKADWLSNRFFD